MTKLETYLSRVNATVAEEHLDILESKKELEPAHVLRRNQINRLLDEGYLEGENGYRRLKDGTTYVAVLTKMPKVSIEMIDWWFWWHAAEAIRYQIWYPEMHFDNEADFQGHYDDESKTFRERLHLSTHLVTEDVGLGRDKILIDFMPPKQFGFDKARLREDLETVICARVGSPTRGVWGTDMCHYVRVTTEGVEMRSRFWIGHRIERMGGFGSGFLNPILNTSFVKSQVIPKEVGIKMFHHCSQEYHNLAEILPDLYDQQSKN